MALIEKYRVCTALQTIDGASETIKEGMLVTITSGGVSRVENADVDNVYGIAGDTSSTTASAMPGVYDNWQNRVSDGFDETKASGKITVYHSGGEFATDQFTKGSGGTDLSDGSHVGVCLVANSAGLLCFGYDTVGLTIAGHRQPVAMMTKAAGTYPSGVPGVDLNGDMALKGDNSDTYIEIKLLV